MNEDLALHTSARPNRPPNFDWMGGSLINNNPFIKCDPIARRASSSAIWLDDLKFGLQHINHMGDIIISPHKYQLILNVQHFEKPEVKIRASRKAFFVKATHAIPKEGHDYVTEHFYREYVLPKDIHSRQACGYLTPENFLVIEAPKVLSSGSCDSESYDTKEEEEKKENEEEEGINVPLIKIESLEQIIFV